MYSLTVLLPELKFEEQASAPVAELDWVLKSTFSGGLLSAIWVYAMYSVQIRRHSSIKNRPNISLYSTQDFTGSKLDDCSPCLTILMLPSIIESFRDAVQCSSVQYYVVDSRAVQCSAKQCSVMQTCKTS